MNMPSAGGNMLILGASEEACRMLRSSAGCFKNLLFYGRKKGEDEFSAVKVDSSISSSYSALRGIACDISGNRIAQSQAPFFCPPYPVDLPSSMSSSALKLPFHILDI
jgi:hypothetical protein